MVKPAEDIEHEIVSSELEQLILVDEDDNEIGHSSKADCHDGDGILHRAFSLFIFNGAGQLLLQKRSAMKRLWPLYWSNSCCSHPRAGETMSEAVHRRLFQELGIRGELQYLYKFRYHAKYGEAGSERESCWVYVGKSDDEVSVNGNEIAEWRYIDPEVLGSEMSTEPETFTPWFKMEWERIVKDFRNELSKL